MLLTEPRRVATGAVVLALGGVWLTGCAAPAGTPAPAGAPRPATSSGAPAQPQAAPTPTPTPTPTVAPTDLPATVPASPGNAQLAVLPDSRSGAQLDRPFTYRGVVLLNKNHPVSKNYAPKVGKGYQLAPEADAAMAQLVAAAKKDGAEIVWRVGYRPYTRQEQLSKTPPTVYGDDAASYVAKPGTSEHQAGLAVDVASEKGYGSNFPKTEEFAWLRAHAHEYGFILRYPEGKTAVTGFNYEPWHYRYVGREVAAAFGPASSLTLEEYLGGR